jgi:chromosome partitioning protein
MANMTETCTVCGEAFAVQFRYQMEERDGAFSFYCSQKCLEVSQTSGGDGLATCDACAKRFRVDLVSQVMYLDGRRRYACSLDCRAQLTAEARGAKLGDMAPATSSPEPQRSPEPAQEPDEAPPVVDATTEQHLPPVLRPSMAAPPPSRPPQGKPAAQVVSLVPQVRPAPSGPAHAPACREPGTGPRRIAVFNHKGGTGKTTTSVSVAAGLAAKGCRVLLVDTDAQGNVAVSLNVSADKSLYHVLVMGMPVKAAAQRVRENLDLVASNETLAAAELYLAGKQNRDRVLRDRLASAAQGYDYVVLDCSPSLSLMNQNALVFADGVLVPVACDYLSLVGVRQVLKTVRNVNQLLHHPVAIWGVLPTFFDARAKICHEAVETLRQHFGDRCLPPIRAAMKVKEAPAHGQTIFEYAAGTNAAEDYRRVVDLLHAGAAGQPCHASEAASA